MNNVTRSTSEMRSELRSELSRLSQERESSAVRTLAEIKTDIATVKGLLLNRYLHHYDFFFLLLKPNSFCLLKTQ